MPIEALPASTSRIIGSTLVLNDAKSVVKELIDNALDARATTINVEISQNTLDLIQVKDNGIGIGVQDRQLLCKRGCTSKIRSLQDLSRLGGSFLGFRGEALASIAELSKTVTVTTRVDGEIVGSSLTFGSSEMLSSSSASHPVGTTFRVQGFLHNIPVRKQTALKSTTKTLQAIKTLLHSFAFARPNVRFSLKVLKAKNDKCNWTYAPSPKDSLVEVASKIVGQDIASACDCHQMCSDDIEGLEKSWSIETLIASPSAGNIPSIVPMPMLSSLDLSKIRNATQYVSVDGRSMTPDRGTIKELVKLYRQKLQASHESSGNTSISRPFLCLKIKCPPESYDVNVEPAKDEVLFFYPAVLRSMLEKLFEGVYPIHEGHETDCQPSTEASQGQTLSTGLDHSASQNGKHSIVEPQEYHHDDARSSAPEDDDLLSNIAISNPFTIAAMTSRVLPKKMNITGTQLNTPFAATPRSQDNDECYETAASATRSHRTPLGQNIHLPSPISSSDDGSPHQNPGPPLRRRTAVAIKQRTGPATESNEPVIAENSLLKTWLTPQTQQRRPVNLEDHTTESPSRSDGLRSLERLPVSEMNDLFPTAINSTSALKWGPGSRPFRPPLKSSSKGQKSALIVPALSSTSQDEFGPLPSSMAPAVADDTLRPRPTFRRLSNEMSPQRPAESQRLFYETSSTVELPTNTELEEILDFEYRKKAAIAQHRRQVAKFPSRSINDVLKSRMGGNKSSQAVDLSTSVKTSSGRSEYSIIEEDAFAARFGDTDQTPPSIDKFSSHQSRFPAVAKELSRSHPNLTQVSLVDSPPPVQGRVISPHNFPDIPARSFREDDPRAYYIRQQKRGSPSKLYRTKSAKLPLETIPADMMTIYLRQSVDAFRRPQTSRTLVQCLSKYDQYIIDGQITYADLVEASLPMGWQDTVRELVQQNHGDPDSHDLGMMIDEVEISIPTHAC
ncbi:hypothetical protein LTR84_009499 [Exophiala bonariae]|uniref:DNA mismatch repair protein S5 domain-containing protein n=1 Tax=Exophiala bonariae TaxID=1690606 RepID=A0AAV9MX34_9EURO|nr:hypothetical protein LTR84_009499 [Exophiala bonariae]